KESIKNLRGLRNDFLAIKRDLDILLRFSDKNKKTDKPNVQFHLVMSTIADLLLTAVRCVENGEAFDLSSKLTTVFNVIDTCQHAKTNHEISLLKFARSFILFMDALHGCDTKKQPGNLAQKTPNPWGNQSQDAQAYPPETTFATKRPRLHPTDTHPPSFLLVTQNSLPRKLNSITRKRLAPNTQPEKKTTDSTEPQAQMLLTDAKEPRDVPEKTIKEEREDRAIKEEIEDIDYLSLQVPGGSGQPSTTAELMDLHEVKFEDEFIKEEPIEEPIADTYHFNRPMQAVAQSSSARRKQSLKSSTPPIEHEPKIRRCPICDIDVACRMEQHVKIKHKDNWLLFVKKCPEEQCDFRSFDSTIIERHRATVHTQSYHTRKETMHFGFTHGTRCPYCAVCIKSMSMFIKHMEQIHRRMCTYEHKIMMCKSCRVTTSHTYEMLAHWLKNTSCGEGMRFNYVLAQKALNEDHADSIIEMKLQKSYNSTPFVLDSTRF
ncbi:hypothetical protein PENTCL1PPCAC_29297, partial [Pristionchus entomophagus]